MSRVLDSSRLVQRLHPTEVQLSPDGSRLVFELRHVDGERARSRLCSDRMPEAGEVDFLDRELAWFDAHLG